MLNYNHSATLTIQNRSGEPQTFPVEIFTRIDTSRVDPTDPKTYEKAEIVERYMFRPETGGEIVGSEEEIRRHLEGLAGKTIQ